MKPISSQEFTEKVEKGSGTAFIDFFAGWCGPCRIFGPIFEEVANEYDDDSVSFYKVDVDASGDIAAKYGVRGIPTVLAIKDGKVVDSSTGLMQKQEFLSFIEKNK